MFSRLYLYFPDFFQVWKIAEQISRLFQEFKTLYKLCICCCNDLLRITNYLDPLVYLLCA